MRLLRMITEDRFSVTDQLAEAIVSNANVRTFLYDYETWKKHVGGIVNIRVFFRTFCVLCSSLL
jgi:hypothetical protein